MYIVWTRHQRQTQQEIKEGKNDFIIIHNGIEIGLGEIKPPGTREQLVDEDRARLLEESMKKQLHT